LTVSWDPYVRVTELSVTLHWLVLRAPYSRGPPSRPLCLLPAMRRPVSCVTRFRRRQTISWDPHVRLTELSRSHCIGWCCGRPTAAVRRRARCACFRPCVALFFVSPPLIVSGPFLCAREVIARPGFCSTGLVAHISWHGAVTRRCNKRGFGRCCSAAREEACM